MPNKVPIEWYRSIRSDAIAEARKQNICRGMLPVRGPIGGIGVQQWSYDKTEEMSEALVSYQFIDLAEDSVGFDRGHIAIPLIQKEFRVGRRDLASATKGGYPITTTNSNAAAYQVTNIENQMVINGYSRDGKSYEIKGLLNSAGIEVTDSYDAATPGNFAKATALAIENAMANEIYGPFEWTINPQQWTQLGISLWTGGKSELEMVEKLVSNVRVTNWIPAGHGMFTGGQSNSQYELIVAQDMTVETEILQKSKDLWGRIYESLVPVVYQPKTIQHFKAL